MYRELDRPAEGPRLVMSTQGYVEYPSMEAYYSRKYAGVDPICNFAWDREPEWVELDGGRIAVYQFGPEDGTPVISFHGTPGSGRGPNPATALLEKYNLRLITFDAPGFGESSIIPTDEPAFLVAGRVAQHIVEELGYGEIGVLARSGGVLRALGFAALHKSVSAMVLVAGLAPSSADIAWQEGMTPHNRQIFTQAQASIDPMVEDLSAIAKEIADEESFLYWEKVHPEIGVLDAITFEMHPELRMCIMAGHAEGLMRGAAGWAQSVIAAQQPLGYEIGENIPAPTLIIHGTADPFANIDHGRWFHQRLPNATIKEVEHGGHFTDWRYIDEQLAFLAGHASTSEHVQFSESFGSQNGI